MALLQPCPPCFKVAWLSVLKPIGLNLLGLYSKKTQASYEASGLCFQQIMGPSLG